MIRRYLITAVSTVLLALTTHSTTVFGQNRTRLWLGAGLGGAGASSGAGGAGVMAELVYQTGAHYFAVRAVGAADPFGYSGEDLGEIGLLYGRSAKRRWGHAAVSTGLAWTAFGSCEGSGIPSIGMDAIMKLV